MQKQISPREGLAPSAGTGAPALEGQGAVAARAVVRAVAEATQADAKGFSRLTGFLEQDDALIHKQVSMLNPI